MNTHRTLLSVCAAFLIALAFCPIAQAGIATTGNIDPANPATWDSAK